MEMSFAITDLGTIIVLVMLEILLSVDNALVLAIMVRHLPKDQQRKALLWGLWGAFILRSSAILLATTIIKFWWLQIIGAIYLVWLPIKHFAPKRVAADGEIVNKPMSFWRTIVAVELMDLAFALDSVLVAVAFVDTTKHPDKLWVVIAGAISGIIILRIAASYFIGVLERYPKLEHMAYALIGWAGVKMTFIGLHNMDVAEPSFFPGKVPHFSHTIFWIGVGLIIAVGSYVSFRTKVETKPGQADELADAIEDMTDGEDETQNTKA